MWMKGQRPLYPGTWLWCKSSWCSLGWMEVCRLLAPSALYLPPPVMCGGIRKTKSTSRTFSVSLCFVCTSVQSPCVTSPPCTWTQRPGCFHIFILFPHIFDPEMSTLHWEQAVIWGSSWSWFCNTVCKWEEGTLDQIRYWVSADHVVNTTEVREWVC